MKRLLRDAMLRRLEYFQATLCSDRRGPHSAIYCTADGCFRKFTLPADTEALASEPLNCECGSTFVCPICAQSGHPGRGCIYGDDYSPVGERRKLFRRRGKYRICPGCGATTRAVVMKEDGCNSIHCIFCREAWCWTCSKSLEPENSGDCCGAEDGLTYKRCLGFGFFRQTFSFGDAFAFHRFVLGRRSH